MPSLGDVWEESEGSFWEVTFGDDFGQIPSSIQLPTSTAGPVWETSGRAIWEGSGRSFWEVTFGDDFGQITIEYSTETINCWPSLGDV